ncbi:hypothetical protein [Rubellicoccus peritrichatus]|uniref:Uncharacterized protein n=1 Tax=Rubellicoccus peritrichatus TaxID=3080537 RepID=A0AAQ3L5T9_9BACT|nr:hypothetical protein [Puniceicoccus sp. CR14]WOO39596.1 hypothetical protein RZN69_13310 [Puniceicoccus sp. CR14]
MSLLFGPPPPSPGGPPKPPAPTPQPNPGPATPPPVIIHDSDNSSGSKVRLAGKESFRGKWKRTDGDYTLEVGEIKDDNTAQVKYFNPNPINVESTRFVKKDGKWVMTVILRDKGYDGSKYLLFYDSNGPALKGRYTVGTTGQKYDVTFKRLKKSE